MEPQAAISRLKFLIEKYGKEHRIVKAFLEKHKSDELMGFYAFGSMLYEKKKPKRGIVFWLLLLAFISVVGAVAYELISGTN